MKIVLRSLNGFSEKEKQKITRAAELVEIVCNSVTWKNRFLSLEFTSTRGKTNQEILDLFLSGDCDFTDADGAMDLKVTLYKPRWRWSKVVGYTNPGKWMIWVNRRFFATPVSIGANLIHEYFHQINFSHVSAKEHTSVPYAAGYLFADLCEEMGLK